MSSPLQENKCRVTLPGPQMNPEKLFDYLNGKLSASEREEIERQLATDDHLRRELAIAREIHSRMRDSPEVLIPDNTITNRGAVLGRRVMIAFAVLVFVNVLFGLYAIAFLEKKRRGHTPEEQNRQQLAQVLEKAAASALPTPSLDTGEIKLSVANGQRDDLAKVVIEEAEGCRGSATRGLPNENGLLIFIELPSEQTDTFIERLERLGSITSGSGHESATAGKTILQVRIVETAEP